MNAFHCACVYVPSSLPSWRSAQIAIGEPLPPPAARASAVAPHVTATAQTARTSATRPRRIVRAPFAPFSLLGLQRPYFQKRYASLTGSTQVARRPAAGPARRRGVPRGVARLGLDRRRGRARLPALRAARDGRARGGARRPRCRVADPGCGRLARAPARPRRLGDRLARV